MNTSFAWKTFTSSVANLYHWHILCVEQDRIVSRIRKLQLLYAGNLITTDRFMETVQDLVSSYSRLYDQESTLRRQRFQILHGNYRRLVAYEKFASMHN